MIKNKQIISNLLFVIILNLLVKPFWIFFIDRVVQNQNGNVSFGTYGKYLSLSFLLSFILDFGISNYNQRNIASDVNHIKADFYPFWRTKLFLSAIYLVILHILFWIMDYPIEEYSLFLMVCLIQVFTSLSLFIRSNASGMQLFTLDSFLSILDKLLALAACSIIIYGLARTLDLVSYTTIQALGFFMVVAIGWVLLQPHFRGNALPWGWQDVYSTLRKSLPFALVIFFMSIYTRFDYFIIEEFSTHGALDAGIYMASYRLIDVVSMIAFLFANILVPYFTSNFSQNKDSKPAFDFFMIFFGGIAIWICYYLYFYATPICELLYENDAQESAHLLSILAIGVPAIYFNYIFSTYLIAVNGIWQILRISFFAAIVYLVASISLLPILGVEAMAYCSSGLYWMITLIYAAVCYFRYGLYTSQWIPLAVLCLLSGILVYYTGSHDNLLWGSTVVAGYMLIFAIVVFFRYRKVLAELQS